MTPHIPPSQDAWIMTSLVTGIIGLTLVTIAFWWIVLSEAPRFLTGDILGAGFIFLVISIVCGYISGRNER